MTGVAAPAVRGISSIYVLASSICPSDARIQILAI